MSVALETQQLQHSVCTCNSTQTSGVLVVLIIVVRATSALSGFDTVTCTEHTQCHTYTMYLLNSTSTGVGLVVLSQMAI